MKDIVKTCTHSLPEDIIYKEVVIIGNGPSGMVTSYMLAGNVPYLKKVPEDLPIDDMLKARLSNLLPGQSLYETDLVELAEGLEGRSQNPIPLLMDNLLRPCADMGIENADSLIEWKYDVEKQIDHIVLGRGPPGGAWHTFPASVRTLSPGAWLTLPPHSCARAARLSARAVALYCRRYVREHDLQRYFRNGVIVTRVSVFPPTAADKMAPCQPSCPLNAAFCVYGYDKTEGRELVVACRRVVLACGAGDRPNTLAPRLAAHAIHSRAAVDAHVSSLQSHGSVLVVGSGASAADAVSVCTRARVRALHVYRARGTLARLAPAEYPDYCQVYKMMCDGPTGNYPNYSAYPEHIIVDVTPLGRDSNPLHDENTRLKRVTLLDVTTNETKVVTVNLIAVLIGSKPDLFFLQTNFNLDCIDVKCIKCTDEPKHAAKRKIEYDRTQCFFNYHWHYLKSVVGQSIQSCKSRYLNYTEINGNNTKCVNPDCNKKIKDDSRIVLEDDCKCDEITYKEVRNKLKCTCGQNPYSSGIGFGIDPEKPVDGRSNPIAIDKGTHELLNAPKGMYALGPLTADNFIRFIPGGALAIVSSIHEETKSV